MKYFVRELEGKLMLCNKEIKVGSKFWANNALRECIALREGDNYPYGEKDGIWHSKHWFAVIGEISPAALSYIHDGQEIEEDDILFVITDGKDWFMTEKAWLSKDDAFPKTIRIKGPCGHFH